MDLKLSGTAAVVTGASKGIGLAITEALVGEGAHVVAGARSRTNEIAALESAGTVTFVAVDPSTPERPRSLIEAATARGVIDVLVNNAGAVTPRPDGFASVTDDDWLVSLTLNRRSHRDRPLHYPAGGR
ncbi:SDR family NAD(P)-dependent oxidoreductase [Nocardia sp. NPDC004340]